MIPLQVMPQEGQFIALWKYNGLIWSDTLRWKEDGKLYKYNKQDEDQAVNIAVPIESTENLFVVLGDE